MRPALLVLLLAVILGIQSTIAQDRPFEGVTIVVATPAGAEISGPIQTFRGEWEQATGGTVDVQPIPYENLHERILASYENGTNDFDVIFYVPQWAGDFMNAGYVLPIPDDIKAHIDWDDLLPVYRDQLTAWGGVTYALPFSGDALLMNYRKDLVSPQSPYAADFRAEYGYTLDEPATWDEYHQIAAFFNRREVETSGVIAPLFGAAEAQASGAQATSMLIARAATFTKLPDEPCFYFSCDADSPMQPRINNTGWVHALADMSDIQNYGSPIMTDMDIEQVRLSFVGGGAALALDWPDLGILSVNENESLVHNALGFGLIPGGDYVWNNHAGEWVEARGGVNFAPFISGGWLISVSAHSAAHEAALDFAAFMADEELSLRLATALGTGVNPFRVSQLDDPALWEREGFDAASAEDYVNAINATFNHPNAVLELRIPGAVEYMAALDAEISRALSAEIDAESALDNAAAAWDTITERYGRAAQLAAYQASLGIE